MMAVYDTRLRLRRANRSQRAFSLALRHSEITAHPKDDRLERCMARVLETGEPQHVETHARFHGDPHERAWSSFVSPLRDEDGTVCGVCVASHDITEQHWARKRLQLLYDVGTRRAAPAELRLMTAVNSAYEGPGLGRFVGTASAASLG
jgi:hypothetical protein